MKAFKRIFASVMVTAMLATMGVSAFADNIQPRAPSCAVCGSGTYFSRQTQEESVIGYEECPDSPAYNDSIVEYITIKYYDCNKCDAVTKWETSRIVQECRHP